MNLLKDDLIIDKASEGEEVKIYSTDDEIAKLIKNYINKAFEEVFKFQPTYELKHKEHCLLYEKWIKNRSKKQPEHKYWNIINSINSVQFKVNHLRQKYWYWKKLKE